MGRYEKCGRWESGTREMVGLPGSLLGLLGLPCGSFGGRGQPIRGRQSPERPPGSGPETILLKEKFEAISTLKEPSRLVRSAEGLALLWYGEGLNLNTPPRALLLLLGPSNSLSIYILFPLHIIYPIPFSHTAATLHVLLPTPSSHLAPSYAEA